ENKILKNKISALKDVSTNPLPARSNPLDDVLQNLVGKLRITEERYGLDARTADVTEFRNTRWAEFNLCGEIRDALAEMHYEYPSPVQFRTLKCFRDRSILVRAKNGTGKTAAYLIPILNQLAVEDRSKGISRGKCMSGDKVARRGRNQRNCFAGLNRSNVYPAAEDADPPVIHRVRAIIMLPTRELALQVSKVAKHIASKTDLLVMPTFGGSNLYEDILRLKKGVDVVVTTPGRIFDLVKRRVADFSECRILVVDEADKLVSAEYAEELETIIQNLKIQQLLLFSATFPKSIDEFVRKNMRRPLYLNLMKEIALKGVTQFYALVRFTEKLACLKTILRTVHFKKCVIFCNSIRNVELLAKKIAEMGYPHYYIHSKMTQDERNRVFHNFADHFLQNRDNKNGDDIDESSIDKNGKMNPKTNKTQNRTKILVSSDLVTRGIDVPTINLVINFDFPRTAESYIHRIRRCGRFGTEGISVSLICDDEKQRLIDIETKLGVEMLPVSDPQFLTFGQSMAE
ncbi:ATP-dependent RNA helicase DHH1, partial [Dictyocoela roeselum]